VTRRESRVLSDAQTLTGTGPDTVELISDCKVLISGMMGREAYEDLNRRNIRSVVTRIESIEDAVQAFLDGKLIDHASR
jgi:predicted Fe-Mo cluster-binding NifX family protein